MVVTRTGSSPSWAGLSGVTLTANGKAVDAAIGATEPSPSPVHWITFCPASRSTAPSISGRGRGWQRRHPAYLRHARGELADLTGLSLTADREMTGTDEERALTLTVASRPL